MPDQITTITIFTYRGFINKIWAFGMMQFAHKHLQQVQGMSFYKLMGSGRGFGFNPLPDWSTYCLLQVWESEADARSFHSKNPLIKKYQTHTIQMRTFYMRNIASKGLWSGQNPFTTYQSLQNQNSRLAVITRATIRLSKLRKFWSYVPTSQKYLSDAKGLLFTKGIGEIPIVQMATFSLWENLNAIQDYAYRGKEHMKAIQMTRKLDWYKEELFARFEVIDEEYQSEM